MPNPRVGHGPDRPLEMIGSYTAPSPAQEPAIEDALERAARLVAEGERAGVDDVELGIRLGDMARICFARQAWAEALPPLTRLLALSRAAGEDRAEVATVLSSLGTAHYALGEHREAAQLWEEALHIRERWLVPNHFLVARSVENLADARVAQGKMDEALTLLHRALTLWQQTLPPTDPTLRAIRSKIGDLQLLASQEVPGGVTAVPHLAPSLAPLSDFAHTAPSNGVVYSASALHPPVSDAPVLRAPVLDSPVHDAPAHHAPLVDARPADIPVAEAPAIDAPVLDDPIVDTPAPEAQVLEARVLDEPVLDEPVLDESIVDESIVDELVVDASVDDLVVEDGAQPADTTIPEDRLFDAAVVDAPHFEDPVQLDAPVLDEPVLDEPVMEAPEIPAAAAPPEEPAPIEPKRPLISRGWLELHRSTAFSVPEPQPAPPVAESPRDIPVAEEAHDLFVAPEAHDLFVTPEARDVYVAPELDDANVAPEPRDEYVAPAPPEPFVAPAPREPADVDVWRAVYMAPIARDLPGAASPLEVPIPVNAEWDPSLVGKRASRLPRVPSLPSVPRGAMVAGLAVGILLIGALALRGGDSAAGENAAVVASADAGGPGAGGSPAAARNSLVRTTSAGSVARGTTRASTGDGGRARTARKAEESSAEPRTASAAALAPLPAAVGAQLESAMRAVDSTTVARSDSAVRQMLYGGALGLSSASSSGAVRRAESEASASRAVTEEPRDMKPAMLAPGGPQPVFPFQLLSQDVRGDVVLQVLVDASGHPDVHSARIVSSSHPLFTASVMRALPTMRFIPAEAHGQKVAQQIEVPFRFDRKVAGR